MMRKILLVMSLVLSASTAWAIPQDLNFQGFLKVSGVPFSGSRNLTFCIFDQATNGNLKYSEQDTVNVSSGVFSAVIGDITGGLASVFDGNTYYVQVDDAWDSCGTTNALLPRQKITSVGNAFFAAKAAELVGGAAIQVSSITVTTATVTGNMDVLGELKVGEQSVYIQSTPGGLANAVSITNNTGNIRTATTAGRNSANATGNFALNIYAGAGGPLSLNQLSSGNVLVANGGGRVGISTNSPQTTLDVSGSAQFGDGAAKSTFTAAGLLKLASPLDALYGGTGADLSGGAAGGVPYFSATGIMSAMGSGTAGQVLTSQGSGAPIWTAAPTDNTRVAKAGDTMTGQLTIGGSSETIVDTNVGTNGDKYSLSVTTAADRSVYHLAITTGGSVGIGTANPATTLDVNGGGTIRGQGTVASTFTVLGQDASGNSLKVSSSIVVNGCIKFPGGNQCGPNDASSIHVVVASQTIMVTGYQPPVNNWIECVPGSTATSTSFGSGLLLIDIGVSWSVNIQTARSCWWAYMLDGVVHYAPSGYVTAEQQYTGAFTSTSIHDAQQVSAGTHSVCAAVICDGSTRTITTNSGGGGGLVRLYQTY